MLSGTTPSRATPRARSRAVWRSERVSWWPDMQALTVVHRRRLREIWRSAGWPCQDMVEVELLAAGWLERVRHASGHETLRVTDAGIAVLAETLQRNRSVRDAHEA